MPEAPRILPGNLGRDRHVPRQTSDQPEDGWKRKHVRGFILSTKTAIENAQLVAGSYQNVHHTAHANGALGPRHKPFQRRLTQSCRPLAQYHQWPKITVRQPLTASCWLLPSQ